MGGGALAASHYLIKSTKQISPKVLNALKGKAGPTGAQGKAGPTGAQGKEGPVGKEGKQGAEGREGLEGLGAIEFRTVTSAGAPGKVLAELDGIKVTGSCDEVSHEATLTIEGEVPPYFLELSGTVTHDGELEPVDMSGHLSNVPEQVSGTQAADLDVIARNSDPIIPQWTLMQIDAHGEFQQSSGPCLFLGVITPSGGEFSYG
jgi:Collagen triple helix repeat (20 copies)